MDLENENRMYHQTCSIQVVITSGSMDVIPSFIFGLQTYAFIFRRNFSFAVSWITMTSLYRFHLNNDDLNIIPSLHTLLDPRSENEQ